MKQRKTLKSISPPSPCFHLEFHSYVDFAFCSWAAAGDKGVAKELETDFKLKRDGTKQSLFDFLLFF